MASTPIYNWPTPDNTGLVKNGALDMRTLGNAIDTTMGTMVPKTIVDAKGDLIAGTAADTTARLAVGSNGETLVADSSTATGLRYQGSMAAGRNGCINGGMDIWQRGTSFTNGNSTTTYGPDRWRIYSATNTGRTWSRQSTNDTTNLPFIQYCVRAGRNSGDTQTNTVYVISDFETVNSIPFAGKTITLSYYARKGANYSQTSSVLNVSLITGTGTDQNSLVGYTGSVIAINTTATLTTTWQRFSHTVAIDATATEIALQIGYAPSGTAGANDYFELTGVQIEVGSVATQFSRTGGTIQGELDACCRYYEKNTGTYYATCGSGGFNDSYVNSVPYKVEKRATPTLTIFSGNDQTGTSGSATWYASATGTVATATQESNTTTQFTIRRAGSSTASFVIFSYTSSAEL